MSKIDSGAAKILHRAAVWPPLLYNIDIRSSFSKEGESVIRPLHESSQWKKIDDNIKKTHPTDTYSNRNIKKLGRFNEQSYVCTNVKQDPGFFNVTVLYCYLIRCYSLLTYRTEQISIILFFFKWHLLSLAV